MDVSRPKRKYRDLKKVSLAHEEESFQPEQTCTILLFFGRERWSEFPCGVFDHEGNKPADATGRSSRVGTCRIYRHGSAHLLSFERFVVQIPNPRAASKRLLAARHQNRVTSRTFRAES